MSSLLLRFPQDGAWDPDKTQRRIWFEVYLRLGKLSKSEQAGRTGLQTDRFESL